MKAVVPREVRAGETRVALVPESVSKLVQAGIEVSLESGAGRTASFTDEQYAEAGAGIEADVERLLAGADLILEVGAPDRLPDGRSQIDLMRPGAMLLASLFPTRNAAAVRSLAERGIVAFSTDCIPRTTRAQTMDTLSSQANIVGYKGVLLAAVELPRYFPMFMTAAGTTLAARVFVIGAGVAGLQAIATARRLGASVTATDVRPEVKEQIESVGGKYVGIDVGQAAQAGGGYAGELSEEDRARQALLLAEQCAVVDVVITTALIGGVIAPKLIDESIVRSMKPGSLIVDLGADGGGNCTLSRIGGVVDVDGVRILAPTNVPATMPQHASLLFSRNLTNFVTAFWRQDEARLTLDWQDDILAGAVVTRDGEVVHAATRRALGLS